jgi:hypothetical protein
LFFVTALTVAMKGPLMSRSNFPRVAKRTIARPKKPRVVKLPPLMYGIYDTDGELLRVSEVDDPRARICTVFNELESRLNNDHIALPIIDEAKPRITRRRKAVAQ